MSLRLIFQLSMFQNFERFFPTRNLQASVSRGVNSNVKIKPRLWLQSSISTRISRHWEKERARIWIWMKIASPNIVDTTRFWPIQFFSQFHANFYRWLLQIFIPYRRHPLLSNSLAILKRHLNIDGLPRHWNRKSDFGIIFSARNLLNLISSSSLETFYELVNLSHFVQFLHTFVLELENIALNHICVVACFTQLNQRHYWGVPIFKLVSWVCLDS